MSGSNGHLNGSIQLGRPSLYTPEIAAEICKRMSDGESLRQVCRDEHMPHESTVRLWHVEDREGFSTQYARAREAQADRWAEEIIEIADDSTNDWMQIENARGRIIDVPDQEVLQRSKLRVDTRKWLMSKLLPKRFGDKVQAEMTGEGGGPIKVEQRVLRLRFDSPDGVDV